MTRNFKNFIDEVFVSSVERNRRPPGGDTEALEVRGVGEVFAGKVVLQPEKLTWIFAG